MKTYLNADVIGILRTIMEGNTKHYKTDFKYDVETLTEATNPKADKHFVWLSRESGTELFHERSVYISGIYASNSWKHYAGDDNICAYIVDVIGMNNGIALGNIYELDYLKHVKHIEANEMPVDYVELFFKDGTHDVYPYEYFNSHYTSIFYERGEIERRVNYPKDDGELQNMLNAIRKERSIMSQEVYYASSNG